MWSAHKIQLNCTVDFSWISYLREDRLVDIKFEFKTFDVYSLELNLARLEAFAHISTFI